MDEPLYCFVSTKKTKDGDEHHHIGPLPKKNAEAWMLYLTSRQLEHYSYEVKHCPKHEKRVYEVLSEVWGFCSAENEEEDKEEITNMFELLPCYKCGSVYRWPTQQGTARCDECDTSSPLPRQHYAYPANFASKSFPSSVVILSVDIPE